MHLSILTLTLLSTLLTLASAQFQFFEQMFNGGPQQQQQQQHHHHGQEQQNVASDSEWYQRNYEAGNPLFLPSSIHPPFPLYPQPPFYPQALLIRLIS